MKHYTATITISVPVRALDEEQAERLTEGLVKATISSVIRDVTNSYVSGGWSLGDPKHTVVLAEDN